MINLHERMLPTTAGVEPATSWSPVRRRIQLSHRGRPYIFYTCPSKSVPRLICTREVTCTICDDVIAILSYNCNSGDDVHVNRLLGLCGWGGGNLWVILVRVCEPVFWNLPHSYTWTLKKRTHSYARSSEIMTHSYTTRWFFVPIYCW